MRECPASRRSCQANRLQAPQIFRRWRAGTYGSDRRVRFRAVRRTRSERLRTGSHRWRQVCGPRVHSLESVAVLHATRLEAPAEPLLALGARAVREGFLVHVALNTFLDGVVTHGGSRGQRFVDVAAFDDLPRVRFGFGRLLLRGANLVGDAGDRLHVMAYLVRDDIRLGEVTLRGELGFELAEKCE